MIKLNNVFKSLESFSLKDISFEIPEGYICGLVGQNGAGKTSLLNVILGLYKINDDCGEVEIFGKKYDDSRQEILDNIGTVLVDDFFEENLNIMENAESFGQYFSRYSKEAFEKNLQSFNLEKHKKTAYRKLSKGEKLKFQFAFAMAHDPKLLVLDEPTGNFDPEFRKEFFDRLMDFIADGQRSVILATHLTDDLDRIADYLLYIEEGKLVFAGDIESFHEEYRIVHGERYKINLLPKENVLYIEEREYDTKALVKHSNMNRYGEALKVLYPSIEEFMYCYSKRKGN